MLLLGLAPWDDHPRLFWYHQGLLSLRGLQKGALESALPGHCPHAPSYSLSYQAFHLDQALGTASSDKQ